MPDNINQIKRQKEEKTKKIAGGGLFKNHTQNNDKSEKGQRS